MAQINENPTLGQRIRDARVGSALSLRALARELDVAASYVNDIEHDRRVPSEGLILKIAAELNMDADQLLAAAGRIGQGAERFMKKVPAAGVLFRRMSTAGLDENSVNDILRYTEKVINKRNNPKD